MRSARRTLGLLLDTYHMNIEEPSIETSIRAAGPRIYHFHVADSNRWPPGGGHLDFAAILRALAATGYGGFVSGEFLPAPDAATAAQRGLAASPRTPDRSLAALPDDRVAGRVAGTALQVIYHHRRA